MLNWRRMSLARIAHRFSTAETDSTALTTLFLPFNLDVTRHAVARKSANKYRHIDRLRSLATKLVRHPGSCHDFVDNQVRLSA